MLFVTLNNGGKDGNPSRFKYNSHCGPSKSSCGNKKVLVKIKLIIKNIFFINMSYFILYNFDVA